MGEKHDLVLLTATLFCRFGMVGARSKKEKFAAAPVLLDVCHCFGHSCSCSFLGFLSYLRGRQKWPRAMESANYEKQASFVLVVAPHGKTEITGIGNRS